MVIGAISRMPARAEARMLERCVYHLHLRRLGGGGGGAHANGLLDRMH